MFTENPYKYYFPIRFPAHSTMFQPPPPPDDDWELV